MHSKDWKEMSPNVTSDCLWLVGLWVKLPPLYSQFPKLSMEACIILTLIFFLAV
jgi:hypothetical protein